MQELSTFIERLLGIPAEYQVKIFASIIAFLVLGFLRKILLGIIWKRTEDIKIRYRWQKNSTYFSAILLLIILGQIWFEGFEHLATFIGLVAAGLVIALKDIVASFAGWLTSQSFCGARRIRAPLAPPRRSESR